MGDNCSAADLFHGSEFECAECDYKAGTETEMIDHSAIHRDKEESIIGWL